MFGRLFFDNDLINFLNATSGSKVSMVLLNGSGGIINEHGNYITKIDDGMLSYVEQRYIKDEQFFDYSFFSYEKRVSIKIGRFVNKFISNQAFNDLNITNNDIEIFVNLFKSYFNQNKNSLRIVEGDEIMKWYLEDNYLIVADSKNGSLWRSCMRQYERNKFLRLYALNPKKVKMLVYITEDNKLRSRALLWEDVIDIKGNKLKVMDRVYSVYDHDVFLFKSWAKENGYISKLEQNSKSEIYFDVNGTPMSLGLYTILDNHIFETYPYLDTFKYFNPKNGQFSNSDYFNYRYKLVQSNGLVEREDAPEPEYYDEELDF